MLAYGAEEFLAEAVAAVLASDGVEVELVLVDNGAAPEALARVPHDPRVTLLEPGRNLGFTGGVNLGAATVRSEVLALVNSDAIVEAQALRLLAEHLDDHGVGVAGATILLADSPDLINSAGNPLHVLGLSWAGDMDRPAASITGDRAVASASGACLAVRRSTWEDLGGFPEELFAYVEDMELSWRCWQRGLRVEVLADARALHHYEFSRSPLKMYLVERNRLLLLLTVHEARTLVLLGLPLLAFEIAILVVACVQGWGREKVRGWRWILTHQAWVRERRRLVQSTRTVPDARLVSMLTDTFDPAQTPLPPAAAPLESVLRAYWRLARRFLRDRRS
ncbi:GT2 family glycosyltransferase [Sanguibacter antarcticus]|uniref:GT2 family glycosyltransferase n=2 Tax=Sanguibacter antarcticus TaxID=372484 RepID=A0A2A9E2U4_9MICO|nr:GT2 family glycosyltransferase [Sanguibacter antarcticus]